MNKKMKAALVASAVGGMFLVVGCGSSTDTNNNNTNSSTNEFKCEGGNACKGQGKCKGEGHDCAGKGECKGKGFIMVKDQAACDAAKEKLKE